MQRSEELHPPTCLLKCPAHLARGCLHSALNRRGKALILDPPTCQVPCPPGAPLQVRQRLLGALQHRPGALRRLLGAAVRDGHVGASGGGAEGGGQGGRGARRRAGEAPSAEPPCRALCGVPAAAPVPISAVSRPPPATPWRASIGAYNCPPRCRTMGVSSSAARACRPRRPLSVSTLQPCFLLSRTSQPQLPVPSSVEGIQDLGCPRLIRPLCPGVPTQPQPPVPAVFVHSL